MVNLSPEIPGASLATLSRDPHFNHWMIEAHRISEEAYLYSTRLFFDPIPVPAEHSDWPKLQAEIGKGTANPNDWRIEFTTPNTPSKTSNSDIFFNAVYDPSKAAIVANYSVLLFNALIAKYRPSNFLFSKACRLQYDKPSSSIKLIDDIFFRVLNGAGDTVYFGDLSNLIP